MMQNRSLVNIGWPTVGVAAGVGIGVWCGLNGMLLVSVVLLGISAAQAEQCDNEGEIDPCLIGQWRMDKDSLAKSFMGGWPKNGVLKITGKSIITFKEDGSFTKHLDKLRFRFERSDIDFGTDDLFDGEVIGCYSTLKMGIGPDYIDVEKVDDQVKRKRKTHDKPFASIKETDGQLWTWWPRLGRKFRYQCEEDGLSIRSRHYIRE